MLDTHLRPVNRTLQGVSRFLGRWGGPLRSCYRISSSLFNALLPNRRVAELLNKCLVDLKDPSIVPYFQSLIDSEDYEFFTDPVNFGCEKIITLTVLGYKFEAGFSVAIGVVSGYQGSETQTVVDVVYEARPNTFSLQKPPDRGLF